MVFSPVLLGRFTFEYLDTTSRGDTATEVEGLFPVWFPVNVGLGSPMLDDPTVAVAVAENDKMHR